MKISILFKFGIFLIVLLYLMNNLKLSPDHKNI